MHNCTAIHQSSDTLQYLIILPTHHFKEALEKKMVKSNRPPLKGLVNTLCSVRARRSRAEALMRSIVNYQNQSDCGKVFQCFYFIRRLHNDIFRWK